LFGPRTTNANSCNADAIDAPLANAARTQKFDYSPNGLVQHTVESDASGFLHDVYAGMYPDGSVLYKTYYPGPLNVGTDANRWTYDKAGRLKSIPGMVTDQTYEVDGQTKKITYANGVSTEFFYSATRHWLERIVTKNAAGTELMNNFYSRDSRIGRIYAVAGLDVNNNWSYTYDDFALRRAQEPDLRLQSRRRHNV
jgi:hypothetical protein